jgi:hypothetical protein
MENWLITVDNNIYRKTVLRKYNDATVALEEFRSMYMKEILGRNQFGSFTCYNELECYGDDIIDAIHHTPREKYTYHSLENLDLDTWEFSNIDNKKLYTSFIKFVANSDAYCKKYK